MTYKKILGLIAIFLLLFAIVYSFPYIDRSEINGVNPRANVTINRGEIIVRRLGPTVNIVTPKGHNITIAGDIEYDSITRMVIIQINNQRKQIAFEKFLKITDNTENVLNTTANNFRIRNINRIQTKLELRGNKTYLIAEVEVPVRVLWIFRMKAKVGSEAELDEDFNIKSIRLVRPWWWIFVTNQEE